MITKELLKQVLTEQRIYFLDKKFGIRRDALERILQKFDLPHIHVITGVRRCGKSTLLRQIVSEYYHDREFYYLSFEDERLLNFEASEFNLVYETMVELFGPHKTFFIDEIQLVDRFDAFVRRFYDQGFKFYVTGSNAGLLQEEISTRLTGRHIDTHLQPFSFREYLLATGVIPDPSSVYKSESRALIHQKFNEYLVTGGMPEYVIYRDSEIIRRNYEDIITRDIFYRKKAENIQAAKELYLYLVSSFAQRFSFNSLHKSLRSDLSVNTIKKYTGFLAESYLVHFVNRFDFSVSRQLTNDKKCYVCDNAFVRQVSTKVGIDKGWLLENLVAARLVATGSELFYFSGRKECDFITMREKSIESVYQVCWELDPSNEKREMAGLLDALEHTGLSGGIILTGDQEGERTIDEKQVQIIPAWKWMMGG